MGKRFDSIRRLLGARVKAVSAAGFGVEIEEQKLDADRAREYVRFLEDREVLFLPWSRGCPGGVLDALEPIRARTTFELQSSGTEGGVLLEVLVAIRENIRELRYYACRTVHSSPPQDLSCRDCKIRELGCVEGLETFRERVGQQLLRLSSAYGLQVTGPIMTYVRRAPGS
jgi:hypothetical protein